MGLSALTDPSVIVVADASVAINLNATGHACEILRALPNRVLMADAAIDELDLDRRTGRRDAELLTDLISAGLITSAPLGENALRQFEELVIGHGSDTLDDGEAATIVVGLDINGFVVIDERKAIRICGEKYPALRTGSTMDILSHNAVRAALGDEAYADAIYHALRDARMRVAPAHTDWVIDCIGRERAAACPSLSRIK